MDIYLDLAIIMAISVLAAIVDSHVCILKKRPDPSNGGILRWSLPFNEICHCQRVVAPEYRSGRSCVMSFNELDSKLWFTDDPESLTHRENWNRQTMDRLLQRINYRDTEKPVIVNVPGNIVQSTDIGLPIATVTWVSPTAYDNSCFQTLISSHSSGDSFPIGVTKVNYTSTDAAGNVCTETFTITVKDNEHPVIVGIPENISVESEAARTNVTWVPPIAVDNSASQTLTSTHRPGDSFALGVTLVTYTSTDAAGNTVTESFTVTVKGAWVIFQRRFNGSIDFFRGWNEYEQGFGTPEGEYWAGLQKVHELTRTGSWFLRIDLEDVNGNTSYAEYESFAIGNSLSYYQLSIGTYTGTANDSLAYHNGQAFSTKDKDNDNSFNIFSNGNCAIKYQGAWWYDACVRSNLNGLYMYTARETMEDRAKSMSWKHWPEANNYVALKRSEMKIRRVV